MTQREPIAPAPYDAQRGPQDLGQMWLLEKFGDEVVLRLWTHPDGWELTLLNPVEVQRRIVVRRRDEIFAEADKLEHELKSHGWIDPTSAQ
jgi:hypothetical protein